MDYKKVAIFYHSNAFNRSDAECTGHITPYLKQKNIDKIDYYLTTRDTLPEDTDKYDILFVLGGDGSVFSPDRPAWMSQEINLIKQRIAHKQKTVGICLGAQMLALAAGGQVSKNKYMEFGFHAVNFHLDTEHPVLKNVPKSEIFMHWHHDGFCPPKDSVDIASNHASLQEQYDHASGGSQGFVHDDYIGLQFHPETCLDMLELDKNLMDETTERYKQSKSIVLDLAPLYLARPNDFEHNCARDVFYTLLNNFLGLQNNDPEQKATSCCDTGNCDCT